MFKGCVQSNSGDVVNAYEMMGTLYELSKGEDRFGSETPVEGLALDLRTI